MGNFGINIDRMDDSATVADTASSIACVALR